MSSSELINDADLLILRNGSQEDCSAVLKKFIIKCEKKTNFEELTLDFKKSFYDRIFARISNPTTSPALINILLNSLRILCRELSTLDVALTEEHVRVILKVSKLKKSNDFINCGDSETLEALKVIFNMTFQSKLLRSTFEANGLLEGLVRGLKTETNINWEIKYFQIRILFIMTALMRDCVQKVRRDLNGLNILIDDLQFLVSNPESYDDHLDLICEMLKVLYNLMHSFVPTTKEGKSRNNDSELYMKAVILVKTFLLYYMKSVDKKEQLQSHSVDLLAVIPTEMFDQLIDSKEDSEFNFEKHDMAAIESLVVFLDRRLDVKPGVKAGSVTELLSPILCVLVRMASTNRLIRKYLKLRILPPLKKADVLQRPELGDTLRNKLCALMTSSAGPVSNIVCNFLFILVKENVQRLVKYTGFGNAAGLLANRGLLGGGAGPSSGAYSSESDDSDTSEYKEVSHLINGFGWIEPEHPPPCAGMTEEQKEFEAMKLVDAIDKLNRSQLIQPLQIGRDGRLQPIEHVCQLLEQSSETLVRSHQRLGSDSSDST